MTENPLNINPARMARHLRRVSILACVLATLLGFSTFFVWVVIQSGVLKSIESARAEAFSCGYVVGLEKMMAADADREERTLGQWCEEDRARAGRFGLKSAARRLGPSY